jgi:hypothetical protein
MGGRRSASWGRQHTSPHTHTKNPRSGSPSARSHARDVGQEHMLNKKVFISWLNGLGSHRHVLMHLYTVLFCPLGTYRWLEQGLQCLLAEPEVIMGIAVNFKGLMRLHVDHSPNLERPQNLSGYEFRVPAKYCKAKQCIARACVLSCAHHQDLRRGMSTMISSFPAPTLTPTLCCMTLQCSSIPYVLKYCCCNNHVVLVFSQGFAELVGVSPVCDICIGVHLVGSLVRNIYAAEIGAMHGDVWDALPPATVSKELPECLVRQGETAEVCPRALLTHHESCIVRLPGMLLTTPISRTWGIRGGEHIQRVLLVSWTVGWC